MKSLFLAIALISAVAAAEAKKPAELTAKEKALLEKNLKDADRASDARAAPLRSPAEMRARILASQPEVLRQIADEERQVNEAEAVAMNLKRASLPGFSDVVKVRLALVRMHLAVLDYVEANAEIDVHRIGLLEDDPADRTEEISRRSSKLLERVRDVRQELKAQEQLLSKA